mmetsp:Transcript_26387/g.78342  ORF Transcript_26387/g.78342 Transcript_26387/m.78342 type:complete len:203 (+) Transcript_26387:661-1269(+)
MPPPPLCAALPGPPLPLLAARLDATLRNPCSTRARDAASCSAAAASARMRVSWCAGGPLRRSIACAANAASMSASSLTAQRDSSARSAASCSRSSHAARSSSSSMPPGPPSSPPSSPSASTSRVCIRLRSSIACSIAASLLSSLNRSIFAVRRSSGALATAILLVPSVSSHSPPPAASSAAYCRTANGPSSSYCSRRCRKSP